MAIVDAPVGFALAAGTVAAFNPCGFAMLPAYLSFFLGNEDKAGEGRHPVARALAVSAAMTVGFVVVFGLAGLAIEVASLAVGRWTPWITLVLGVLMVPIGVAMAMGRDVKVSLPRLQRGGRTGGLASMATFGASYATVSLSCTLPVFLAAVNGSFQDGDLLGGLATYVAYAVGMGLVVAVLTVAIALARDGLVRRLRRSLPTVHRIGGAFLVLTGAYVAYYGYYEVRILRGDDDVAAGPVTWVTDLSGRVSGWLDGVGTGAFVVLLAALVVAGVWRRRRRPTPPPAAVSPTEASPTAASPTEPTATTPETRPTADATTTGA